MSAERETFISETLKLAKENPLTRESYYYVKDLLAENKHLEAHQNFGKPGAEWINKTISKNLRGIDVMVNQLCLELKRQIDFKAILHDLDAVTKDRDFYKRQGMIQNYINQESATNEAHMLERYIHIVEQRREEQFK